MPKDTNFCSITVPFEITETKTVKQEGSEDEFFHFKGYASTFGNSDRVNDVIVKGAFTDSINKFRTKKIDMPTLWQHDTHTPVGVFPSMDMFEDQKGLFVHGILPLSDTFVSGRVKPQMKVGSVRKMSIGFNILKSFDKKGEDGEWRRFIEKADLMETSLVTFACNDEADVTEFKSKEQEEQKMDFEGCESLSDVEDILKKEKEFSNTESKELISVVSKIKKLDAQRDAEKLESEKQERDALEGSECFNDLISKMETYNQEQKDA